MGLHGYKSSTKCLLDEFFAEIMLEYSVNNFVLTEGDVKIAPEYF